MSCNLTDERLIIKRTAFEIKTEFAKDWKNANKFYTGKFIEITGIPIYISHSYIGLGEESLGNNYLADYLIENIMIECGFKSNKNVFFETINEKDDKEITILGKYQKFFNSKLVKSIILKNCIIISNDLVKNDINK